MLNWIENYTKSLVGHPDQVSVSTTEGTVVVCVNVSVSPEDHALFGGKNNRLTRAMGVVLGLTGAKERKRYVLKVVS